MLDNAMVANVPRLLPMALAAPVAGERPDEAAEDASLGPVLLEALGEMAVRSKRRQADLTVALRRAGVSAPRERITAALEDLFDKGYIDDIIPLSDGGLLLCVTSLGIDRMGGGSPIRMVG